MRLVVKLGGSLCIGEHGPIIPYITRLLPVLASVRQHHQLILAVGGGKLVRTYFKNIEPLGFSDEQKEWIAIDLLQANARTFAYLLGIPPLFSLDAVTQQSQGVIAGIAPGRSTDANAALAATQMHADLFVKLTNVDAIYDRDPHRFPGAKRLSHVPFADLHQYAATGAPGSYGILDRLAMDTIVHHKIKSVVMSGADPANLLRLLDGEPIGTEIS